MTAQALILQGSDAREEFRRWSLAAAIVFAAHFALLAGYALMPAAEPDGAAESPAVLVDLAPAPVAPASPDDIAPGPDMLEAQPTPKPPEQVEPQVVEPMPRIEAPAEVTLPLPEPKAVEKMPEENPDKQKSETTPVEENTPAPQTTAAPRSEQNTAATPQAPSPGSRGSQATIATWRSIVTAKLKSAQRYPARASARNEQGTVTVTFVLNRNGNVLSRNVVRSSGHAELDQEALAMITRAAPFPPFPPSITGETINLPVPIQFRLHQ
jgi:periplasmic protein TonB